MATNNIPLWFFLAGEAAWGKVEGWIQKQVDIKSLLQTVCSYNWRPLKDRGVKPLLLGLV
ncbi:hypothetical protein [Pseudoalteromonas piscicida]|uniref:hypothetical protein n=1 Tax=Pseudoalteromonas piscicida TaxID=43662 RepID=UPI0030A240AD